MRGELSDLVKMMKKGEPAATLDMKDAMKSIMLHCKITGQRRMAFRIKIGIRLLKLAALVMGLGVKVDSHLE